MANDWVLAELERMLAGIVRKGVIAELDAANARVRVSTGGLTTDWLPWIAARAGATRKWSAPTVGEQVVILSPSGDTSQGVVLPAIYQDDKPAPAASASRETAEFSDGSTVDYDAASHTLTVNVGSGNVVVNCKSATVQASESVTLDTPAATCTGALTVQGLLTFSGGATGSAGTGGGAAMSISGAVAFSGGTLTHNGVNVGSTHTHREQGDGNLVSAPQ